MITLTDNINVDPDMRQMLNKLMRHYHLDEGRIIRVLLQSKLDQIKNIKGDRVAR